MEANFAGGIDWVAGCANCLELKARHVTSLAKGQGLCDLPLHAKRVFQHFYAAHEVNLYVLEGPTLSLEERDAGLAKNMNGRLGRAANGRTRISALSISHSLRSRSYFLHSD